MAKTKETKTVLGLMEQIGMEGIKEKKVYLLVLDFILPPPVYKDTVTTKSELVGRTVGGIKEILRTTEGFTLTLNEGIQYVIPYHSVKYYQEE